MVAIGRNRAHGKDQENTETTLKDSNALNSKRDLPTTDQNTDRTPFYTLSPVFLNQLLMMPQNAKVRIISVL